VRIAVGIFFILYGLFFLVFRSDLQKFARNSWYKRFPNIKIFERQYGILFFIAGVGFILGGLLLLTNLVRWR